MLIANKLGFEVSYGAILAAILGYSVSMIISLVTLNRKYKFNFNDTVKRFPSYIIAIMLFVLSIVLLKNIIPTNLNGRFIQIPIIFAYAIVSFGIYIGINYINGNLKALFNRKRRLK